MVERIQKLPRVMRFAIFSGGVFLIVGTIVGVTLLVGVLIAQNTPRQQPVPLNGLSQTEEYFILADEDSYPSSVAVDAAGTVYTGSYVTGAVWAMDTRKTISEIPNTREQIGSVTAITVASDGALLILDRISPLEAKGAKIWRLADGNLTLIKDYTDGDSDTENDVLQLPDDLAVDSNGRIYVTDRGIDRNHDIIWRILPDGTEGVWWQSPPVMDVQTYAPTGIAYHAENNTLIITDSILNTIYAVKIAEDGSAGDNITLYDWDNTKQEIAPGFDGVSVAPDGKVYVASLGSNKVSMYDPNTGLLTDIAGNYRGAVDVVYDALTERIFVANWDQRSLLPSPVLFIDVTTKPHLPFTIDVIRPQ